MSRLELMFLDQGDPLKEGDMDTTFSEAVTIVSECETMITVLLKFFCGKGEKRLWRKKLAVCEWRLRSFRLETVS